MLGEQHYLPYVHIDKDGDICVYACEDAKQGRKDGDDYTLICLEDLLTVTKSLKMACEILRPELEKHKEERRLEIAEKIAELEKERAALDA